MPELLLLHGDSALASNDNDQRIERGFNTAGWTVQRADHDSLRVQAGRLKVADRDPLEFDLIWPLGFGRQATFFDRMQLLGQLPADRFITSPDAFLYLHGKHRWLELMPETHTSTDPGELLSVIRSGGDWVIKPTAGSFGRDVHRVADPDTARQLLQQLAEADTPYLIAQRYVPEIQQGEKRTLVAGGELLGSYLRRPGSGISVNLSGDGQASATTLNPAECDLISPIAAELARLGVGFAAVDVVFPYLMEVNVANPGGLATIETLTGTDLSDALVRALLRWKDFC